MLSKTNKKIQKLMAAHEILSAPSEQELDLESLELIKIRNWDNDTYEVSFKLDGEPCPLAEANSKLGKACAGYQMIIKDLKLVKSTLQLLIEKVKDKYGTHIRYDLSSHDHLIVISLFTSSVVTYAKCFTKALGRSAKLSDDLIKSSASKDLLDIHNRIMTIRHNFVAHAGMTAMETSKTIIILDPLKEKSPTYTHHVSNTPIPATLDPELFLELAEYVLIEAGLSLSIASAEFYKNEVLGIDMESAYKNSRPFLTFNE